MIASNESLQAFYRGLYRPDTDEPRTVWGLSVSRWKEWEWFIGECEARARDYERATDDGMPLPPWVTT